MSLHSSSVNDNEAAGSSASGSSGSGSIRLPSFTPISNKPPLRQRNSVLAPKFDKEPANKSHLVIDPPPPKPSRTSLKTIISSITIEPTLLLYCFSWAIYSPVFSFHMMHKLCRQTCGYTEEQCLAYGKAKNHTVDVNVQKAWAEFDMYSTMFTFIPGIIFALFMGPWSDVFGRKKLLTLPSVGTIIGSVFMILLWFVPSLPMWMGFVPTALHGLFGAITALVTGAYAYAADISHEGSSRTIRINRRGRHHVGGIRDGWTVEWFTGR